MEGPKYDNRITQNRNGQLVFLNVQPSDENTESNPAYVCIVELEDPFTSTGVTEFVYSAQYSLSINEQYAPINTAPPFPVKLSPSHPSNVVALYGQPASIECIWAGSGSPPPSIIWQRLLTVDAGNVATAFDYENATVLESLESTDAILTFASISFADEGYYLCRVLSLSLSQSQSIGDGDGDGDGDQTTLQLVTFHLVVQTAPIWDTLTSTLEDVADIRANGSTAAAAAAFGVNKTLICSTYSIPDAHAQWYINGEALGQGERDGLGLGLGLGVGVAQVTRFRTNMRSTYSHKIRYAISSLHGKLSSRNQQLDLYDVPARTSFLVQCNVSNVHGYLWKEFPLLVKGEAIDTPSGSGVSRMDGLIYIPIALIAAFCLIFVLN